MNASEQTTPKITIVGSLNMDLVVRVPRLPISGETLVGHDFYTAPGGKGANQAVAAARQGADVTMIGHVGDDAFGKELIKSLKERGIESKYVATDPVEPTGTALVTVNDVAENHIVVIPGANKRLAPVDIDRALLSIAKADLMIAQLEIPLETVVHAVEVAKKCRVPVILNPAPAQPLPSSLLTEIDFLILNESEVSILVKAPVIDPLKALAKLASLGSRRMILTLGSQGAILMENGDSISIPGFPVTAIDTTGAGDAFIGAFAVAWLKGKATVDAVRWANAAGALATTLLGAQPSLPDAAGILQLLQSKETT